jgi:hypothetical protein
MRALLDGDASFEVLCDDVVAVLTRYPEGFLQVDYYRGEPLGEPFCSTTVQTNEYFLHKPEP